MTDHFDQLSRNVEATDHKHLAGGRLTRTVRGRVPLALWREDDSEIIALAWAIKDIYTTRSEDSIFRMVVNAANKEEWTAADLRRHVLHATKHAAEYHRGEKPIHSRAMGCAGATE